LQIEIDAQFLNESFDLVLLIENMSMLAENRSKSKESYLLAADAAKTAKSLHSNYKWEALRHRIKLISDLSTPNDDYLHRLDNISAENFDMMYTQHMKEKLKNLTLKMESYTANGKNERLVELADEVRKRFRTLNESLNKII